MLKPGDAIPDVTLIDLESEPVRPHDLTAGGAILLSFHLYDWTDTCKRQVRALRDRHQEFAAAGVRVFGVSRDSPYSHRAYSVQQWLNYPLLSDWSGDAVRAFGVGQICDGLVDTPVRSCFLLAGGEVAAAWSYADDELPDLDELLAAARELRLGGQSTPLRG